MAAALASLLSLLPLMLVIGFLIKIDSSGPVIHWSRRVGFGGVEFRMPKFRTMHLHVPLVETAKIECPEVCITRIGRYLRLWSLDELPQIFSILFGDMSLIGYRPALYNQYELIRNRNILGIHLHKPGLTGLAQIKGRDMLSDRNKLRYEFYYALNKSSIRLNAMIICSTIKMVISRRGISH
jgi:O-antigen biosynthesis protein WbqP